MAQAKITEMDFARTAREILDTIDIKRSLYLDQKGDWQFNPSTLDQCASHEILYQCRRLDAPKQIAFFQDIRSCLRKTFALEELESIQTALDKGTRLYRNRNRNARPGVFGNLPDPDLVLGGRGSENQQPESCPLVEPAS